MTHSDVSRPWWQRVRRSARSIPLDGVLVIGYVVVAAAMLYVYELDGLARTLIGLPLTVLLPGYVLVAALFPAAPVDEDRPAGAAGGETGDRRLVRNRSVASLVRTGSPGWYERLALAVATSLALLPVFGLVLATTRWGFSPESVLVSLGGFVGVGALVATVRRLRLPPDRRFRPPLQAASADARRGLFAPATRLDGVLNLLLLLSIVVALGALGYALITTQGGAAATELQVLTESENGDLVAAGYPDDFADDEELVVAVTNEEGRSVSYTVVVEAHHVEGDAGDLEVLERSELLRLQLEADDGETVTQPHTVAPTATGETMRLNYYLYRGDAPDEVDGDDAYRHVWITADGTAGGDGVDEDAEDADE